MPVSTQRNSVDPDPSFRPPPISTYFSHQPPSSLAFPSPPIPDSGSTTAHWVNLHSLSRLTLDRHSAATMSFVAPRLRPLVHSSFLIKSFKTPTTRNFHASTANMTIKTYVLSSMRCPDPMLTSTASSTLPGRAQFSTLPESRPPRLLVSSISPFLPPLDLDHHQIHQSHQFTLH